MDNCIFCGAITSFRFEGDGEYKGKIICPRCQSEKLKTTFTGCSQKDKCTIKLEIDKK
ncbi:MAG: hypothetical protein ACTSQJ_16720 [Promethearchaeota archaeon]